MFNNEKVYLCYILIVFYYHSFDILLWSCHMSLHTTLASVMISRSWAILLDKFNL